MNYETLSSEELIVHINETNDEDAKNYFFKKNNGLIHKVCHKFDKSKIPYDDRFSICAEGMIKSIKGFKPEFGYKFTTYVIPMMEGEIRRFLRDKTDDIKFSRAQKDLGFKIIKFKLENEPIEKIISVLEKEEIIVTEENIKDAFNFLKYRTAERLDKSVSSGGDNEKLEIKDMIPTYSDFTFIEVESVLESVLTPKEKEIVIATIYEDKSQVELGKEYGISQAHISRITKKAFGKLRKFYGEGKEDVKMGVPKKVNRSEVKFIIENYPSLGAAAIGRVFGVTQSAIDYYVKGNKLDKEIARKPDIKTLNKVRLEYNKLANSLIKTKEIEEEIKMEKPQFIGNPQELEDEMEEITLLEFGEKKPFTQPESEPLKGIDTSIFDKIIKKKSIILKNEINHVSNHEDIISLLNGIISMIETTPKDSDVKLNMLLEVVKK